MNRRTLVRALCCLLWCIAAPNVPQAVAAPACPSGTLVIGTDATFPPFSSKVGDSFVGLEIDLGTALGQTLGCEVRWVNSSFDGIFPALLSGKYDMVIASVTITPERKKSMLFSAPYMDAGQAIAVRIDGPHYTDLEGLKGHKVGVGLNTTGQFLVEPIQEITLSKYPSVDLALTDLRNGRLDAAVGDQPVFRYMIRQSFPDLTLIGSPLNQEQWGMVFSLERSGLRDQINGALQTLRDNGTVKELETRHLGRAPGDVEAAGKAVDGAGSNGADTAPSAAVGSDIATTEDSPQADASEGGKPHFRMDRFLAAIPLYLKGARWTLALSLGSFAAAVPLGLLIALGRLSRLRLLRLPATIWVETLRGTPLLVQIFFIYFVLPAFGISFADSTSAIMALSINASAYIAEIFRAGLESLEAGQGEAAEALGLTRTQSLRYVLIPQAIRRVVPPLTNECIALIKESSLVSVMGMTELTRTGQELASRYADPLTIWPGVALTYFAMTFPLARLSARLENRLHAGQRADVEST